MFYNGGMMSKFKVGDKVTHRWGDECNDKARTGVFTLVSRAKGDSDWRVVRDSDGYEVYVLEEYLTLVDDTLPNGFKPGDRIECSSGSWYSTGTVVRADNPGNQLAMPDTYDKVHAEWDKYDKDSDLRFGWMSTETCKLIANEENGDNDVATLNEMTVTDLVNALLAQGVDPEVVRTQVNDALESKRDYWDGFAAGREAAKQELTNGYETDELRKVHRVYYNGVLRDVTVIGIKKSSTWRPLLLVLEHRSGSAVHDEPQVKSFKFDGLEYRADVTSEYADRTASWTS